MMRIAKTCGAGAQNQYEAYDIAHAKVYSLIGEKLVNMKEMARQNVSAFERTDKTSDLRAAGRSFSLRAHVAISYCQMVGASRSRRIPRTHAKHSSREQNEIRDAFQRQVSIW